MAVGGRLGKPPFLPRWIDLFPHPHYNWLTTMMQEGLRISFTHPPPLSNVPKWIKVPANVEKAKALRQEVRSLLEKDAIEIIENTESPGFYSHLFVVPKPGNRWRPVIDLSVLNKFINAPHFRMETTRSVRHAVRENEWAVSLDLTDAYLHIPIHRASRKYLRFAIDDVVYAFKAMPFGLNLSPWIFTRTMEAVISEVRKETTSEISHYLDDFMQKNMDPQVLSLDLDFLMHRLQHLGFLVNIAKSDLTPSKDFNHLGMHFLTDQNRVQLTEKRIEKITSEIQNFMKHKSCTPREIAKVIGQCSSAAELLPLGRLQLRCLQFAFADLWNQNQDWDMHLPMTKELRSSVKMWSDPQWLRRGVTLVNPPQSWMLFSDSSLMGWGGHLVPVSGSRSDVKVEGVWSQEDKLSYQHINELELLAVFRAVTQLKDYLMNQSILLMSDNTTVVAYIKNQGGTHSRTLCNLTVSILQFCAAIKMQVVVRFIPGRLNLIADNLSRQAIATEWMLHPEVFQKVLLNYPSMEIDLFATRFNHQLERFVSPFPDNLAEMIDGLSVDWNQKDLYAFPPFPLIPKVIQRLHHFKCQMTLIAPLKWNRSWITPLLQLCTEVPRKLPLRKDLLVQDQKLFHPDLESLNLHVFRLSAEKLYSTGNIADLWLRECSKLEGPPL